MKVGLDNIDVYANRIYLPLFRSCQERKRVSLYTMLKNTKRTINNMERKTCRATIKMVH